MISHVVIFRTRQKDKVAFLLEGARKLEGIEIVKSFHCGQPLASDRPAVDDFFDVAIVVGLDSAEDLPVYANHPIHLDFVENCLKKTGAKVTVFDIR